MSSRNIMMGYLNRFEDTENVIDKDGWLHSGDIGCEQEDGYFKVYNSKASTHLEKIQKSLLFFTDYWENKGSHNHCWR